MDAGFRDEHGRLLFEIENIFLSLQPHLLSRTIDLISTFLYIINIIKSYTMKRVFISFIIAVFIFIPFLSYPFTRENWPTYMGNQYLTGNNDGIIPETQGLMWTFQSSGRLFNPVSVNGRVFVVSTDHYLYCLDAADGTLLWEFKAEGPLTRMITVYEGYVYLPAGRFIYCLEEQNGTLIWGRRDPSFGFYGTPTVARGKIFYGNRRGFYARELRNGHLMWENTHIYTYGGFPSYWNGMVYTLSKEFQKGSAFIVALNEEDGSVAWSTTLENVPNFFSPVVYNERIYLTYGNLLGVFDAETGERLFQTSFEQDVASHPVFSQGNLFISLSDGKIMKIDPETGEYEQVFEVSYGTQFAVVGSYLFIPEKGEQGALVTVDASEGKTLHRTPMLQGEPSTLTISKGVLFVPAENTLLAIGDGRWLQATYAPRREALIPGAGREEKATGLFPEPGEEKIGGERFQYAGKAPEKPESEGLSGEEFAKKAPEKGTEAGETPSEIGMATKKGEPPEQGAEGTPGAESPAREPSKETGEKPYDEAEPVVEKAKIKGELKDKDTGAPLDGSVEATTELDSGEVVKKKEEVSGGKFEVEVPREGKTDLVFSSPGYTFETITLPDEKAIDDLSLQPLELSLSRVKKGERLKVESIHFKTESANLEPGSLSTLNTLLDMLRQHPNITIEIEGHTDSTGTSAFNQKLSVLRAESVADWLIRNGISSKRMKTTGYGDTKPVADNNTAEGRRKNRRTEILIVDD
jgi:outer membrane protein OmpA-like peptidoglycan-associated protein/outer membrane protein assembly factor BamB